METDAVRPLIVHAPNVHLGGGLVLLESLMSSPALAAKLLILDDRARSRLHIPAKSRVHHVKRSVLSRLSAEWRLWKTSEQNDVVLCFHGLPPLFRLRGRVVLFVQNRILVNKMTLSGYPAGIRIRLLVERWFLKVFSSHADKVIVQTPSMAHDVRRSLGKNLIVSVKAFATPLRPQPEAYSQRFDFVYVSNDDLHKNHAMLLDAWRELSNAGLRPSLALTVPVESALAATIANLQQADLPHIVNLGALSHHDVLRLYRSASALIFPSYTESFGLPLIEATQAKLPILAPELDYVRDLVVPAQTFDPHSAVSIARAVKRHLGRPDPTLAMHSSDEFLSEVRV